MVDLFEKNEPQDIITVSNVLKNKNKLDEVGGPAYLANLTDIVPVAANIIYYAKIIRSKAILRRLIQTSTEIAARCYEEQDDIDSLVDDAEQTIFEISRSKSSQGFQALSKIIPETFKRIEKLAEKKELITGVPTGYDDIDNITAENLTCRIILVEADVFHFDIRIAEAAADIKAGIGIRCWPNQNPCKRGQRRCPAYSCKS